MSVALHLPKLTVITPSLIPNPTRQTTNPLKLLNTLININMTPHTRIQKPRYHLNLNFCKK